MNKYKIRNKLRTIADDVSTLMNDELNKFGINAGISFSHHVTDRLLDRSKRLDIDITRIENILKELYLRYLGTVLHHARFGSGDTVVLYMRYKNNLVDCLALGTDIQYIPETSKVKILVRTFIPMYRMSLLPHRDTVEIKKAPVKRRSVSPLQKLLYSSECPESLRLLR